MSALNSSALQASRHTGAASETAEIWPVTFPSFGEICYELGPKTPVICQGAKNLVKPNVFWAIYRGIISPFISIYNDRRDPHQAAQRRTLGGRSMSEASLPVVDGVQSNQKKSNYKAGVSITSYMIRNIFKNIVVI